MQNVGEGRYDIRIEVKFPDDLTKEEVNELDKDIKARLPFYIQKVAAFRASRLSKRKPSDAQTDDPQDARDNRVPLPGPVEFESVEDSLDPNMVIFPAHLVETAELPSAYANKLMIFGYSTEYDGFQLWVTPEGYDYLLMAHHRHLSGDFVDQNGVKHKDCPHFHELDLKKPWKKGEPSTKRIVCQGLAKGMPAIDLIEKFLTYYYFDDGREGDLARPIKNYTSQRKINEPW